MATRVNRYNKFGWNRDTPDHRDMRYTIPAHLTSFDALPSLIDMRPQCPAPYNQLELGACTGEALTGLVHFDIMKQDPSKAWQPSALFVYYNERVLGNSINEDAGAELRDGIKSLVRWGVCPEQYWPYIIDKFKTKPSAQAYKNAITHRIDNYMRLWQDEHSLKACLVEGFPFVLGISAYESFQSDEVAATGIVPMPTMTERLLGGHAVMCVGYDDSTRMYIVRNSYGIDWGQQGYFLIPYDYVHHPDLAADMWVVKFVPND